MKKLISLILLLSIVAGAQSSHYPPSGGGSGSWKTPVATSADLPSAGNTAGDARTTKDTGIAYVWDGGAWIPQGGSGGPVGTPNTFTGFDGSGDIESIPGFGINTNGGMDESLVQQPNNGNFETQNGFNVNFEPLQNSPNEGWNLQSLQANLDNASSGFSQGTAGTAVQMLSLSVDHHGTGNVGDINNITMNYDVGNGTDPITIKGISYSFGFGSIHSQVNIDGQIQGYTFQPNIDSGSSGTSNFRIVAFNDDPSIGIPVNGYNGLVSSPNLLSVTNNNNYEGLSISPTITTLTGNAGYNGIGIFGSVATMGASANVRAFDFSPNITTSHGSINGINIHPSITAGDASFNGITIQPNGGATLNNPIGINIQMNGINGTDPQGITGFNSDSRMQVNSQTTLTSAQGFQIGHRIENLFHVPIGSPVTGTDSLGLDMAGDLSAEDNVSLGPIGLGFVSVGFVADMGIAVGKTADKVTAFLPAIAYPDPGYTTGGNVTEMNHIRIVAPDAQGGTASVTNLYGIHMDQTFGTYASAATTAYGIYLDGGAIQNWLSGKTRIGDTTFSAPTADLHLPGVTTAAATASLKIDSGTLMTTPENGAVESDGTDLWWTDDTGTRISLSGGGGGGGANTALSNLASTAVNADINPGSALSINLGSSSLPFSQVQSQESEYYDSPGDLLGTIVAASDNTPSGQAINFAVINQGGAGNDIAMYTTSGTASNKINIETGNASAGASGNIQIQTGTATGARGVINLDASAVNSNANFIPTANNTFNLGSTSRSWKSGFITELRDGSNIDYIDQSRNLYNAAGSVVLAFSGSTLDASTHKIVNVVNPTSAQDAATKSYVDTSAGGQFFTSSAITSNSSAISSGTFTTFSNSPALSFTPTLSGKYKVYSNIPIETAVGSQPVLQIINTTGSATLLQNAQAECAFAAGSDLTMSVMAVYTLTAATPYVFDIQGKALGGSFTNQGSVAQFYIFAERVGP